MIVIGIDPGLANFGYAVVEMGATELRPLQMGLIRTEKSDKKRQVLASDDNVNRGRELAHQFRQILRGLDNVVAFCVEAMSFPRNSSAAAKMAISWGVIIGIATERDIPIFQVRPQEIKKRMSGSKSASKQDIQATVDAMFTEEIIRPLVAGLTKGRLEHPYDALATVVACSDSEALRLFRKFAK